MKTRGPMHWQHARAWAEEHLQDADKQRLEKGGKAARKVRRKIEKIARRIIALYEACKGADGDEEVKAFRFAGLEHGLSTIRLDLLAPTGEGVAPVPGRYQLVSKADDDQLSKWICEVGDWHSGYLLKHGGVQYYKTPASAHKGVPRDYRFQSTTHTLPQWDTDALAAAMEAGEIGTSDLLELFSAHGRWCEGQGALLASCGAPKPLVFTGIDWHLMDGTVHAHPRFMKSTPLMFKRRDEKLQPRSQAPNGRHKQGEHWVGGERLGLVAQDGKLVMNPLGPALCAADAWREEGLPPPLDFGRDWGFLERVVASRTNGGYFRNATAPEKATGAAEKIWVPDEGVTAGDGGKGLGEPEDLAGSRHLRRLVRDLAERFPEFGVRRAALIAKAKNAAEAETKRIVAALAAPEIAELKAGATQELEKQKEEQDKKIDALERTKRVLEDRLADAESTTQREKSLSAETRQKLAATQEELARAKKGELRASAEAEDNGRIANEYLSRATSVSEFLFQRALKALTRAFKDPATPIPEYSDILVWDEGRVRLTGPVRHFARDMESECASAKEVLITEQALIAFCASPSSSLPHGRQRT